MSSLEQSFVCEVCGKSHAGQSTDMAFSLPDEVWAIPEDERASRAKWTTDLCQMGEHYFIRCLLPIPFIDQPGYCGWGVWAQVEWPVFKRYLEIYDQDASEEPEAIGLLANAIPAYGESFGLPVRLHFASSTQRPRLSFSVAEERLLASEARTGISYARYHEIMLARESKNAP